jgi:AbiV family abortive infection protein
MKGKNKTNFYQIYAKAHNNAVELLSEAEILFEDGKYARAYFLAFTGLEEISKSQLAADVLTKFITEDDFWNHYADHNRKIGRVRWASMDAEDCRDLDDEKYIVIKIPSVNKRMSALYVDVESNKIASPNDKINSEEAKSLIHTLRVAIDRIIEITEYWGHQIGTKGFIK